jgi:hypothetical protein
MKTSLWVILLMAGILVVAEIYQSFSQRSWGGIERFTVIQTGNGGQEIKIRSVDPETKEAVMMTIPSEMEISTVGGRGEWKIKALPRLGEKYGKRWVADSIADFLGITYTAVAEDMGIWDRLAWLNLTRQAQWQEVNLEETSWIKTSFYPDGDKVLGLSSVGQKKIGEMFYCSELAKQDLVISIFNTTQEVGLGSRFARAIENTGLKVATVGARAEMVNDCEVATNQEMKENGVVRWLSRTFSCAWRQEADLDKTQVNISIGAGYVKWLSGD